MGDIIAKATGFVIIILLSYAFKQFGIFKKEDKDFLGAIIININLPCVIISGFSTFEYDMSLVVAVIIGLAVSFVGIPIAYFVSRKNSKESQILHIMGCTGYNIGIFTVPFVSSFMSSSAVVCALMFDMGNAVMVFGTTAAITAAIVNKQKSNPIPAILKKLFTTVPFVTYVVMIIIVSVGITFPQELYIITDIGADATAYLAMVMIGVMMEFKIKKEDLRQTITAILLRYGYSFIVSFAIYFLPFDIEIRKALIIAMCSPMSTSSVVLSEKIGCKPSLLGVFSSINIVISMTIIISVVIFL